MDDCRFPHYVVYFNLVIYTAMQPFWPYYIYASERSFTVEKQVKSKKRVADHGEVFTAEREVNAMLDLVKHETERIESTFLEIKVAC